MYRNRKQERRGFTILELLVTLGIFSLLTLAVSWILVTSFRSNRIIWDQLSGQNDARRVLQQVVDSVRRAETSSIGSFPIEQASSTQLVFYANINDDAFRERVRFWLTTTTLFRGITSPTGTPLAYVTSSEQILPVAVNVVNNAHGVPLFSYYGESYEGNGSPLTNPVAVTDVRVIRVQLNIDINPALSPVPLYAESVVQVRNLKTN